jgi:hypothetical protein
VILSVRRFRFWVLIVVALVTIATTMGLGVPRSVAEEGPPPNLPTSMTVTASTDTSAIGGASPAVLAAPGDPITFSVALQPTGSSFPYATPLTLTASLASGSAPHGSLSVTSVTMPGGANSTSFTASYSAADNGVVVSAHVSPPPSYGDGDGDEDDTIPLLTASTAPFDVVKILDVVPATDPTLKTGAGVGNANCTTGTTEPECGTIVLPNGIASNAAALSLGPCTAGLGCSTGSQVVQFVANLGTLYTAQHPATLVIRCDRTLCPGGSPQSYPVHLSFGASGPLNLTSRPCLRKGVALDAAGNNYCTDYVQTHRDRSQALLIYVLFVADMRGST